jgi:hypothetical protein
MEECWNMDEKSDEAHAINVAELLFACRSRNSRPQGAIYKRISKALVPLFDACGPERMTGFGNPVEHP